MKKVIISVMLVGAAIFAFAEGAKVDPITVKKAEAIINTKRLVKIVPKGVNEQTGKKTADYYFEQAGRSWVENREVIDISGKIGPTKYSQYKLLLAARQAGKAGMLKSALSAIVVEDPLTLWDLFMAADELSSDDANMMQGLQIVVQQGICTQQELEAILKTAIK